MVYLGLITVLVAKLMAISAMMRNKWNMFICKGNYVLCFEIMNKKKRSVSAESDLFHSFLTWDIY